MLEPSEHHTSCLANIYQYYRTVHPSAPSLSNSDPLQHQQEKISGAATVPCQRFWALRKNIVFKYQYSKFWSTCLSDTNNSPLSLNTWEFATEKTQKTYINAYPVIIFHHQVSVFRDLQLMDKYTKGSGPCFCKPQ